MIISDGSSAMVGTSQSSKPLLRSCEACRASKAKCTTLQDGSDARKCERCAKLHKECVFAEAQPRAKRGRQSQTRVAEVEKKLDNIYALLQSSQSGPSTESAGFPDLVGSHSQGSSHIEQEASQGASTLTASPLSNFTPNAGVAPSEGAEPNVPILPSPSSVPGLASPSVENDGGPALHIDYRGGMRPSVQYHSLFDRGLLTPARADELLGLYRAHCSGFPFVLIPSHVRAEALSRERPFLFLAIMEMAAVCDSTLQARLDHELREQLGVRVTIESEISVDLLQGLLIYLGWFTHVYRPFRRNQYQLVSLASALAYDLELNNPRPDGPSRVTARLGQWAPAPTTTYSDLELKRLWVGCYYLASALGISFRRPSAVRYTPYLDECCKALASAHEYPSDQILVYFVQIQNVADEIAVTFDLCQPWTSVDMSPERMQLGVSAFVARLHTLFASFPPEALQSNSIISLYNSTCAYAHEVVLHADASMADSRCELPMSKRLAWRTSTVRTNLLLGFLDATKKTLDNILLLPDQELFWGSSCDELKLAYCVVALAKVALGLGLGHDAQAIQDNARVLDYFTAFVNRFTVLKELIGGEDMRNIYYHFARVFARSREWFERQSSRGSAALDGSSRRCDPADLSPLQLVDQEQDAQVDSNAANPGAPLQPNQPGLSSVQSSSANDALPVNLQDDILFQQPPDAFWDEFMNGWAMPMSMDGVTFE